MMIATPKRPKSEFDSIGIRAITRGIQKSDAFYANAHNSVNAGIKSGLLQPSPSEYARSIFNQHGYLKPLTELEHVPAIARAMLGSLKDETLIRKGGVFLLWRLRQTGKRVHRKQVISILHEYLIRELL